MRLTADEAYRKFADNVFAAAFSICRNKTDADDAVHDTFIKYMSSKNDFNDESSYSERLYVSFKKASVSIAPSSNQFRSGSTKNR